MKTNTTHLFRQAFLIIGAIFLTTLFSCKEDDEPVPDPIASFQFAISTTNFLEVTFTNYSQNATTYSWNFGDATTSTDQNPIHAYTAAGTYTVVLTVKNSANVEATFNQEITITDPDLALKLLTGEVSKKWKLYRVGTSMSLGPNAGNPGNWWAGLENNGTRPCLYNQEFTFHFNGTYVFNDNGMFWGESGVFNGKWNFETCFEAIASNMINKDDVNVSAWLSGTHSFTYNPSAGTATLTGLGAWIGIPKLGTNSEISVPASSVTFKLEITQETGYDLMKVTFNYGDPDVVTGGAGLWTIYYASYSNPALEPAVVTEAVPWGEDLENITPSQIFLTFASRESAAMATIDTVKSASTVVFGVNDPADAGAAKVGEFTRTAGGQYQELQFRVSPTPKDIQFTNFTTAKIDIFVPANTDFTTLKRHFVFGFADQSQTQEWWNSPVQFVKENDDVVLGAWTTYTFDLTDVKARTDIDMIYLGIGGGGHTAGGTFYIRNLTFE
jgi:PKD repeat protein